MGSLVERQARDAIDALLKHDSALAKSVVRSHDSVDAMQRGSRRFLRVIALGDAIDLVLDAEDRRDER
jgi:phosphate uptake regulator